MYLADPIYAVPLPEITSSERCQVEKKIVRSHLGGWFTGSAETLMDILNPHVTNWLKNRTGKLKKRLNDAGELRCGHCACAASEAQLDTAHPLKNDRPSVIRAAIAETCAIEDSVNGQVVRHGDIAAALARAKENHEKLPFSFLCNPCNRRHSAIATPVESKTMSEWAQFADDQMRKAMFEQSPSNPNACNGGTTVLK